MEDDHLKNQLIQSYLSQQMAEASVNEGETQMVKRMDMPDNNLLEQFKNDVRIWIDTDNTIKKLQQAIKERNVIKKQITEKILRFMARYNIEDLNTRDGTKLRCKETLIKPSLTCKAIKERLEDNYTKTSSFEELSKAVFCELEPKKKQTLRRLKLKGQ